MNQKDYEAIAEILNPEKYTMLGLKYNEQDNYTFEEVDNIVKGMYKSTRKSIAKDLADYFEREARKDFPKEYDKNVQVEGVKFNREQFLKDAGVE